MPPHHGVPMHPPGSSIPSPLEWAIAAAHRPIAGTATSPHQHHAQVIYSDAMASTSKQSAAAAIPESSASSPPSLPSKPRHKKRTKKYNNFNIFFMLERQLLLQSRGGGIDAIKNPIDTSNSPLVSSKELHLPPLCRRYNHLPLSSSWFLELLANQNKKRPHRKSHGLIPFKELAQTVAKNYREIDDETQSFVNEVAKRLGRHWEETEAIEAKERREQEDKGRAMGIHAGRGKKRKDAPVVSVAGVKGAAGVKPHLSQDEAMTVQQLMGMMSTSPPKLHQVMPPAHFQQHHPFAPHPHFLAHHPMMKHVSENESERLRVEMARAMNAKRDSEQRINMLKEQMTQHSTGTQQEHHRAVEASHMAYHHHASHIVSPAFPRGLPTGHDQYLASLLATAGGSLPLSSKPQLHSSPMDESMKNSANAVHPASLKEVDNALSKEVEALYADAHATLRRHPPLLAGATPSSSAQTTLGHLKKRQRFSFEKSENYEDVQKFKSITKESSEEKVEEHEETNRSSGEGTRSTSFGTSSCSDARIGAAADTESRSASACSDEIGFYKDLYAQILGPHHTPHHAPTPSLQVTTTRDLALLDRIIHSRGGSRLSSVEQTLLENLAARGGSSSRHSYPMHLPQLHYPPTAAHLAGHHPPPGAYASLLREQAEYHDMMPRPVTPRQNRPNH
eukprot:CAMPEP_0201681460 /NCGR_PEP_ID=MMETSP0494-20130426/51121_1 /ASSEMBLY_ACC=CAM_ASM_000839 /TAXON_ID=420259 /ORGANISM="Thalassiosira gravida, Strain GMp14c1" /LENGTH=675 /DNA_ID=CAMNT_0048165207 /DNA_START=118 /DNA_END=2145 /DNA_ORIENTATION=+